MSFWFNFFFWYNSILSVINTVLYVFIVIGIILVSRKKKKIDNEFQSIFGISPK